MSCRQGILRHSLLHSYFSIRIRIRIRLEEKNTEMNQFYFFYKNKMDYEENNEIENYEDNSSQLASSSGQVTISNPKRFLWIALGVMGGLVLLTVCGFLYRNYKEKQEASK
jgi:beta-lactamase regulating signal transducer with metallopeptidase domain